MEKVRVLEAQLQRSESMRLEVLTLLGARGMPLDSLQFSEEAMVLAAATGQRLAAYMEEKLWSRLGVEGDAFWLVDASETELAFCGLNARLRDYARFGLLCLNEGRNFRDQQILPARWIRDSIAPNRFHLMPGADNPGSSHPHGYGYHWWLPPGEPRLWLAAGFGSQLLVIEPESSVVVVVTSTLESKGETWDRRVLERVRELARTVSSG